VLPYYTNKVVQNAILVENIRWYQSILGFRVMIYDNKGAHKHVLVKNNLLSDDSIESLIDYHDYTIFDLQHQTHRASKLIIDTDQDKVSSIMRIVHA
jgi:hypothetical protein